MKSFFEVQQLLKNYGTIIYTGDKELDYQLMEDELRELYNSKLISIEQFKQGLLILISRRSKGE